MTAALPSAASETRSAATASLPATILAASATPLVILAITILPFLTPAWVGFEQGRADAQAWTGFTAVDLRQATDAILHDLVIGPPAFDVAIGGRRVLEPREQAHMRDVRGVFSAFYGLAGVALFVLAALWWSGRSRARLREGLRRGIRLGSLVTATGLVIAGAVVAVAFDAAFEVFHRIFFPAGSYDFDPRTDRLVQLFPEAFWSETAIAVGAAALGLALMALFLARGPRPGR